MRFKPYFRLFSEELQDRMRKSKHWTRISEEIKRFGEKSAVVPMKLAKWFWNMEVIQDRILRNLKSSACKKGHIPIHSDSNAGFRRFNRAIGNYKAKRLGPFRKPHPRIPFRELDAFYNG